MPSAEACVRPAGTRRGAARPGWPLAGGIIAGTVMDAVLGDPRRGHPVAVFGRGAQALQDRVYRDSVLCGAGYTALCVLSAMAPAVLAERLTRRDPWLTLAATAAAAWTVTGAASLTSEAERIRLALQAGDLELARTALPSLCGRDPQRLDEQELVRAVIESVAENASDAVVAPLLWGAAAGLPGFLGYRAINTLDAMVGYRSARYARFGWMSARLDDVANWVPARVTGLLAGALAGVAGGRTLVSWQVMRSYRPRHGLDMGRGMRSAQRGSQRRPVGARQQGSDRTSMRCSTVVSRAPAASCGVCAPTSYAITSYPACSRSAATTRYNAASVAPLVWPPR